MVWICTKDTLLHSVFKPTISRITYENLFLIILSFKKNSHVLDRKQPVNSLRSNDVIWIWFVTFFLYRVICKIDISIGIFWSNLFCFQSILIFEPYFWREYSVHISNLKQHIIYHSLLSYDKFWMQCLKRLPSNSEDIL